MSDRPEASQSRRDLLKKAAIGGGAAAVVWAAPTVSAVAGTVPAEQTDTGSTTTTTTAQPPTCAQLFIAEATAECLNGREARNYVYLVDDIDCAVYEQSPPFGPDAGEILVSTEGNAGFANIQTTEFSQQSWGITQGCSAPETTAPERRCLTFQAKSGATWSATFTQNGNAGPPGRVEQSAITLTPGACPN